MGIMRGRDILMSGVIETRYTSSITGGSWGHHNPCGLISNYNVMEIVNGRPIYCQQN